MKKWWDQPLVVAANLPLIVVALRWNWLAGLRLANQLPNKLTADSEIMWLLIGAACFIVNVFNLSVIYRQTATVVQQPKYQAASWLLAAFLMAGLVAGWSHPASLILPRRITWLQGVVTAIVAAQAFLGNYFLLAVRPEQTPSSLSLPTLTWLLAALAGWPWSLPVSRLGIVVRVLVLAGVLLWHALNLKIIWQTANNSPFYQVGAGLIIASWLSLVIDGGSGCWHLWRTGWPDLLSFSGVLNLLLLAVGTQFCAVVGRQSPTSRHDQYGKRWLLTGAVLAIVIQLGVAGLVTLLTASK